MSTSAVHDVIIGASMSPSTIHQCQSTNLESNIEENVHRMSGAVSPSLVSVKGAEPKAPISTHDLLGFLTAIPIATGLKVESGTITVPYKRRANEGLFATGSDLILAGTDGIAVPTNVTASQGDDGAVANADIWFVSTDGLIIPVTTTTGGTAAAQSFNAAFSMGPAAINSTELPMVTRTTVNFGLEAVPHYYGGGPYPQVVTINFINPTVEIEFEDFDSVHALGPLFSALTSCDVYYRKALDGDTYVPDATAQHVRFTLSGGLVKVNDFGAEGTDDGKSTLQLTGKTLAVSTASAISI